MKNKIIGILMLCLGSLVLQAQNCSLLAILQTQGQPNGDGTCTSEVYVYFDIENMDEGSTLHVVMEDDNLDPVYDQIIGCMCSSPISFEVNFPCESDLYLAKFEYNGPEDFTCDLGFGERSVPVKYTYFEAEQHQSDHVKLNWGTSVEINNDKFEIEHSSDGNKFNAIGDVKGKGESFTESHYSFLHRSVLTPDNFYRIKQIDFDGQTSFSGIRNISMHSENFMDIGLSDAESNLNLRFYEEIPENSNVMIYNQNGKMVDFQSVPESSLETNVDVSNLVPGMYFIYLNVQGEVKSVDKFVKNI